MRDSRFDKLVLMFCILFSLGIFIIFLLKAYFAFSSFDLIEYGKIIYKKFDWLNWLLLTAALLLILYYFVKKWIKTKEFAIELVALLLAQFLYLYSNYFVRLIIEWMM